MSSTHTKYHTDGPFAILTFNRPDALNAMTWDMYQSLADTCDRVDGDSAVKVLILSGAGGKAFIAGTDIAQFQLFDSPSDGVNYEARLDAVLDRLERVTKPTIAQIQGVAAGGGCAIALCCDLRVATPESTFGVPIARTLGNTLSAATCSRMLTMLGPSLFKEMMFTGRLMTAVEAHAARLVHRIVEAADLTLCVRQLAMEIASNAPLTIRSIKEMTGRLMEKQQLGSEEERDLIELCYASDDFKEGISAFLSKRPPQWTGA